MGWRLRPHRGNGGSTAYDGTADQGRWGTADRSRREIWADYRALGENRAVVEDEQPYYALSPELRDWLVYMELDLTH
jgi:hypothetical protein